MTTHALRTWYPLPTPIVAQSHESKTVILLAFAFDRDRLIYVSAHGEIIEEVSELFVRAPE
jgi:hypothetical protein